MIDEAKMCRGEAVGWFRSKWQSVQVYRAKSLMEWDRGHFCLKIIIFYFLIIIYFRYSVVFVTWNPVKCLGQLIHNGCTRLHYLVVGVMGGF